MAEPLRSQSLAEEVSSPQQAGAFPWGAIVWYAALLVALYAPVLARMVYEWATVEEMGHGFFVFPVAGYIVWSRRHALSTGLRPDGRGLLLVLWGFVQLVLGTAAADFFLARTAFLFSLAGVLWTLGGLELLRRLAFPLGLLVFSIRIPLFIYSQLTLPLQLLASRIAEVGLTLLGIPVLREGNILELASQRLSVVEACSGIRSLLSLVFLALVYGYFFEGRRSVRVALAIMAAPIAILTNSARVMLTGILSEYDPELTRGWFHQAEGWLVFLAALAGLLLSHRLLLAALCWARRRRDARVPA
ncbi:MAG: exosortase/archaeosortase family protein [Bryobacterales bacterium]|nr:exosortase/archaeosortase family protein [Bryobacteraceae bacterium]MDW8131141.1 exosortase/archaeosortase family protein [Bryobacterales bacterium]